MGKARAAMRIKEAVGVKKATNRSGELVALKERYTTLRTHLKHLIIALKSHHASMIQYDKSRLAVAKQVGAISENSPIFDHAGKLPSKEGSGTVMSFASIHLAVSERTNMYADKYQKFVVDYTVEWEKVITHRINTALKQAEVLRRDLDHYQKKVESLRQSANAAMAKGKQVDASKAEKLSRNEEKLLKSREEYEVFASDLCILIEEVTERSWKDLHPLLIKMAQFDSTLSDDQAKIFVNLSGIVESLKDLARKHGLKPQARLKDLENLQPKFLSTKGSESSLEAQKHGALMNSPSHDGEVSERAGGGGILSPGGGTATVSPKAQDSGGAGSKRFDFDKPPSGRPPSGLPPARSSSFHSTTPDTSDMMAAASNSAPPPTMEAINTLTIAQTQPTTQHQLSSGSLPPLPPAPGAMARSASFNVTDSMHSHQRGSMTAYDSDSNLSVHSLPQAPAPAAPPPPPPPSLSMYSSVNMNEPIMSPTALEVPPEDGSVGSAPAHPWSMGAAAPTGPQPGATPDSSGGTNPFGDSFVGAQGIPGVGPAGGSSGGANKSTNPFE